MALHLITGPANAGKTGVLHDAVLEAAREGRVAVVLLPSFAEVQRARAEFAGRLVIGVEVQTLDKWAERQWANLGDGRAVVSQTTRVMLAEQACRVAEGPLEALAGTGGLGDLLGRLASRAAGEQQARAGTAVDAELIRLLEVYRQSLAEKGLVELGEAMGILGRGGCISGAVIAVNRFTDISPAQERLLVQLSADNEVYVALTWVEDKPAVEALTPLVGRLRAAGAEEQNLAAIESSSELQTLEARLFDPADEPAVPTGAVRLCEAAGAEAEAALVAAEVHELVQSGIAPHDIAVAFRDLSVRSSLLAAAFCARGLETSFDLAVPLRATPLGAALYALVSVVAGRGGRPEMMAFLHSGYSGAEPERVESFDAWCRGRQVVESATILKEACKTSERVRQAADLVRRMLKGSVSEDPEAWPDLLDLLSGQGGDSADRTRQALDTGAGNALLEAASEAARLGLEVGALELLDALSATVVSSRAIERKGAVYVTEVHRMRARRFEAVVLGGLTSSEFSSAAIEPLLVSVLKRLGLPSGSDERLSERLLFYSVVTRARRRLVLVRQSSDSEGAGLRPSVFWEEVVDVYRTSEQARTGQAGALTPAVVMPLSQLAQAAPAYRPGRSGVRMDASRSFARHSGAGGLARRGSLRKGVSPANPGAEYSITELERYHACPYGWFYDRVVSPRGLDEVLDARNLGLCAHRLAADFYRAFREAVGPRVTPENLGEALRLFDKVAEESDSQRAVRPVGLAEELAADSAREWVRALVAQDATALEGFAPIAEEWRFGTAADRPFAFEGVKLKGAIDRIDAGDEGLVVVDYKSKADVPGHGSFERYGLLQAVVYAEAAQELLGKRTVAFLYRSLPTGRMRGFWDAETSVRAHSRDAVDGQARGQLRDWAAAAVAAAVKGIEAGDISRRPRTGACEWCGARTFCEVAP